MEYVLWNMFWSKEKIEFIGKNYKCLSDAELGMVVGHSPSGVKRIRCKHGWLRDRHWFKKGYTPWNKGLKGFRVSPATEFKKGGTPPTAKWDGCITLRRHREDGYSEYYIRIASKVWVPLRRYIWEQHNGPIPPGMIIRHKNGNPLDCSVDNLHLVSRAEHLRLNGSNRQRAMAQLRITTPEVKRIIFEQLPELLELKITVNQLSQLIKEKYNEH
jgi:hypothetical protein